MMVHGGGARGGAYQSEKHQDVIASHVGARSYSIPMAILEIVPLAGKTVHNSRALVDSFLVQFVLALD
jgi:hypothetical protein